MSLSRRHILALGAAAPVAACSGPKIDQQKSGLGAPSDVFAHGIASGDPSQTGVVIWTRVTPENDDGAPVDVQWSIEAEGLKGQGGTVQARAERDYTIKLWIDGLSPGASYRYSFSARNVSVSGTTRTLPEGAVEKARFAVVSCANYQAGFFNAYHHIAQQEGLDAVIHLGDYFYEYGREGWGGERGESLGRLHEPAHEIVTLADYRRRHAQYRSDPDLQAMTAAHPLIAIWDDHESANDSYADGAENHQSESEGDWTLRKLAALKAYYEWMPVREPEDGNYLGQGLRSFSYGDLLTLALMETRLQARAKPINIDEYTADMTTAEDAQIFRQNVLNAPDRRMLSETLESQIVQKLAESKRAGQPWRLLANQVILGRLETPDFGPYIDEASMAALEVDWPGVRDFVRNSAFGLPVYPDSWDGYPWARDQFYTRLKSEGVSDILCLTGDAHEFWVNDLTDVSDGHKMGVELVTSSVSSPTLTKYFGEATADYSLLLTQSNDGARYYDALYNGYMDITVERKKTTARFMALSTVTSRDYAVWPLAQFTIRKDSAGSLKVTRPKGLNVKQRALFHGLG